MKNFVVKIEMRVLAIIFKVMFPIQKSRPVNIFESADTLNEHGMSF